MRLFRGSMLIMNSKKKPTSFETGEAKSVLAVGNLRGKYHLLSADRTVPVHRIVQALTRHFTSSLVYVLFSEALNWVSSQEA